MEQKCFSFLENKIVHFYRMASLFTWAVAAEVFGVA